MDLLGLARRLMLPSRRLGTLVELDDELSLQVALLEAMFDEQGSRLYVGATRTTQQSGDTTT